MLRLYDWACNLCGERAPKPELVPVPSGEDPPSLSLQECNDHGYVEHTRTVSLVSRYTGDQARSPRQAGGRFDTLGYQSLPPLPDLPGADDHARRLQADLSRLPDNASHDDRKDVMDAHYNSAPHEADYASLFSRAEYKEAQRERAKIAKQNKQKRKRAAIADTGANINFRADKCAGDPII